MQYSRQARDGDIIQRMRSEYVILISLAWQELSVQPSSMLLYTYICCRLGPNSVFVCKYSDFDGGSKCNCFVTYNKDSNTLCAVGGK